MLDSSAPCPLDTIIATVCFVLQCPERALRELFNSSFDYISCLCSAFVVCILFFSDYQPPNFLLLFPRLLSLYFYMLSIFPSFSSFHETAAKGLSLWFLLSADPISKGPGDPALAPALLLSSPNSPQT